MQPRTSSLPEKRAFFEIGSTAVRQLVAQNTERQAVYFLALRDIAFQRRDVVPSGVLAALDEALNASPRVAALLFNLPHIRQWCLTFRDFLLHNLHTEGVGGRLEVHAAELRRLLLGSKLAATPKGTFSERLAVNPAGSIHLPGAHLLCRVPPAPSGTELIFRVEGGAPAGCDVLSNQVGIAELWTTDLLVRRPGSRVYTFPVETPDEIQRWNVLVIEYASELYDRWPAFYTELHLLLKGIIAVETPSGETHLSGTFSEVPGAIYLSWADSREVIKEAITHELFHTRLNLLIDHQVFDRQLHDEALFWAPWRFQIRPCIPFLHGVYAHYGMMLHNHLVVRHHSASWRAKLATHLVRLAIADAQWTAAVSRRRFPDLLESLLTNVFTDSRQIMHSSRSELRHELLIAIAGEKGQMQTEAAASLNFEFRDTISQAFLRLSTN